MNIFEYIDNYGIYSFEEVPINEVDEVIFSFLSYVNFNEILDKKSKITISDVGRIHFGMYKMDQKHIIAVRSATKIFDYLKDSKRYRNCLLFNYVYKANNDVQFSALSIEYMKNCVYVSYEGTDQMFSGWKENFILCYKYPTLSHSMAIDYLNDNYSFSNKKLIVGGHSKGGNLAMVAAMNANLLVKNKIKKILNVDGPGLLEEQYKSNSFRKILNKYVHVIPDSSVVGMMLYNTNEYVVKSRTKSILAHDIVNWEVNDDKFVNCELSFYSKQLREEILGWLSKYNVIDKKEFIYNLDYVFKTAKVTSILQLKENKKYVMDLIYDSKYLDSESKKYISELISIFIKVYGDSKLEEFKSNRLKDFV